MLGLFIATVLAQANQSQPLPNACFEKTTRDVVLNTLQMSQTAQGEFTELSGRREGDAQRAAGIVAAMRMFHQGLAMLSANLVLRDALERQQGQRAMGENMVRMALRVVALGLTSMNHALKAAEASTRPYQLERVKRLRSSVDELAVFIGPCLAVN